MKLNKKVTLLSATVLSAFALLTCGVFIAKNNPVSAHNQPISAHNQPTTSKKMVSSDSTKALANSAYLRSKINSDYKAQLAQSESKAESQAKHESSAKRASETPVTKATTSEASSSSVESQSSTYHQKNEEQPSAKQSQSSTQQTKVSTPTKEPSNQTPSKQSEQSSAPKSTSGFSFLGHNFGISSFSGTGHVPADNNVYAWSGYPNYYLVEKTGAAGALIQGLGNGSEVTVNGHTYHVTAILHGVPNSSAGYSTMTSMMSKHAIGIQTCDSLASGSSLSMWFAD